MAQEDRPPVRSSSSQQARGPRLQQILAHAWSEWRVELFIALVVAVAVFLLVEQMQIRETVLSWLRQGLEALRNFGGGILRGLVDFIESTTLSDLTGYALLLAALVFVGWRARWRLMTTPRFTERQCPRCCGDLRRIHRHRLDRLVNVFVPVGRYRCRNRDCRWQGLRIRKAEHE
jgi:hypothetical protein